MGLYYQTEYRLGRRGGRVCRNYTGLRAFLAIAIDLLFILTFEFVLAVLFFALSCMRILCKGVFYTLALPFLAAHWGFLRLERRAATRTRLDTRAAFKPAWAGSDEL